jgi:hypothetical protein
MTVFVRLQEKRAEWLRPAVFVAVLLVAAYLGRTPSLYGLVILVGTGAAIVLLRRPVLMPLLLVASALFVRREISTGTEVPLNPTSLLVPVLLAVWLLHMVRQRRIALAPTAANRPLLLFLAAGLLSLLIGNVTWDPAVLRSGNFWLVQLAQWAIFAFSAGAFWLTANLITEEKWLWRLTVAFLLLGGIGAIVRFLPGTAPLNSLATEAFIRAPFWILLTAVAGGQLLFNPHLSARWRAYLLLCLAAVVWYAFVEVQEAFSNRAGFVVVIAILVWLRWPRLRPVLLGLTVLLILFNLLIPAVWEFAGGDDEWFSSGGARLALIQRVIDVTLRNPITGLGPAAYRPYANATPLIYEHIFWLNPRISSHNNFADLFAHVGLVGLALFGWFCWEIGRLGLALRHRYRSGFAAGYVNGMLAAGAASLVLMMLADWILPFVYNIRFTGFQASVLVWLFLGGLVTLKQMVEAKEDQSHLDT